MAERLEAHYQNRVYYFYVTEKTPVELAIEMYKTRYIFVKKENEWVNHATNKLDMVSPLIQIVVAAAGAR